VSAAWLVPNLETIITLKPDLVIATTAGNREETVVQLGGGSGSPSTWSIRPPWETCWI
jgi:hypothetical protein